MRDILVVEDSLHERERLTKLFAASNYSVDSAESASDAENLLRLEEFRLAILDIGLSDRSGTHLFELMKRSGKIPYIIILTGNASVHLKQRFLDEGAAAYIVKASPAAENDALLATVRSLLGEAEQQAASGIPLQDFLRLYINKSSRELFLDLNGGLPSCAACGGANYIVSFSHRTQLPPLVEGRVMCADCGAEMDPKVG